MNWHDCMKLVCNQGLIWHDHCCHPLDKISGWHFTSLASWHWCAALATHILLTEHARLISLTLHFTKHTLASLIFWALQMAYYEELLKKWPWLIDKGQKARFKTRFSHNADRYKKRRILIRNFFVNLWSPFFRIKRKGLDINALLGRKKTIQTLFWKSHKKRLLRDGKIILKCVINNRYESVNWLKWLRGFITGYFFFVRNTISDHNGPLCNMKLSR